MEARPSPAQAYAIAAAILLLFLVMLNNAVAMLVVSIIGLAAGLLIARRGEMGRPAVIAMAGFAAALAFAVVMLLRG
ncbi:MAG: hypothetical protein AUK03_01325 [Anaerolineae bacterium CG2_30_64_16]|nr:MAG: hypothetical protein AUK03_01325 [Anaerolineae bacterium CG2_30_64_16]